MAIYSVPIELMRSTTAIRDALRNTITSSSLNVISTFGEVFQTVFAVVLFVVTYVSYLCRLLHCTGPVAGELGSAVPAVLAFELDGLCMLADGVRDLSCLIHGA